jgi:hypothetical protein
MHERALQDANFTYTANYTAQFQYFRDVLCQGPAPVIQVACLGPNIRLLNTSDPSIVCSTPFIADNGWSTIECNNTCASDAACEGVYLNIGGNIQDVDGPYGKIRFECEGDELYTVDAYVAYLGGGNGACAGSSSGVDTHNFHVARMGVSCPTEFGSREYVFDDFFFECNLWSIPGDGNPGDVYTCYHGDTCGGTECIVDFNDLRINADVPNFLDKKCIETAVPVTPTPAPVLNPSQSQLYTYSAKFEAAWGLLIDPVSVLSCSGNTPTVRMTCRNGDITFVNSTYTTVNCDAVSPGVMECTDNSSNFVNQFTGVVYVS